MNPESVLFEAEEVERVNRITMSRWMGHGDPAKWDAMSYPDQCDAMEVKRAEAAILDYDAHQRRHR